VSVLASRPVSLELVLSVQLKHKATNNAANRNNVIINATFFISISSGYDLKNRDG
jgi:hypothetical protein